MIDMIDPPRKFMDWLLHNLGELLAILSALLAGAAAYARLLWRADRHELELIDLREILREHVGDGGRHRNADFEARLQTLDRLLHEIRTDVKTLVQEKTR